MFGFLRFETFKLFNLAENIYEFIFDNHKPFQNCLCKCLSVVITKDRYVIDFTICKCTGTLTQTLSPTDVGLDIFDLNEIHLPKDSYCNDINGLTILVFTVFQAYNKREIVLHMPKLHKRLILD